MDKDVVIAEPIAILMPLIFTFSGCTIGTVQIPQVRMCTVVHTTVLVLAIHVAITSTSLTAILDCRGLI